MWVSVGASGHWAGVIVFELGGANSICGAAESGFALTVDPILFRQNRGKPFALTSGPTSSGSFAPVPWCGYAPTRHPWRNGARPASMPVAPPHDTCAQPPDARLAVSARSRHGKANIKSRAGHSLLERGLPANQAPQWVRPAMLSSFAGKPRSNK